jgi:hypothetical protein
MSATIPWPPRSVTEALPDRDRAGLTPGGKIGAAQVPRAGTLTGAEESGIPDGNLIHSSAPTLTTESLSALVRLIAGGLIS